jgi:hypothetical protein
MDNETIGVEPTEKLPETAPNEETLAISQANEDHAAEMARLEAEKLAIQEERDHYRKAYLKKAKGEPEEPEDETEEEEW